MTPVAAILAPPPAYTTQRVELPIDPAAFRFPDQAEPASTDAAAELARARAELRRRRR